ncbi:MAG: hypothetical protein ACD_39C00597G0001 [uncultured bacterium]|nr:MAG: hypothetical protein ACD_39C00597G0001 [uncultured bacterium]
MHMPVFCRELSEQFDMLVYSSCSVKCCYNPVSGILPQSFSEIAVARQRCECVSQFVVFLRIKKDTGLVMLDQLRYTANIRTNNGQSSFHGFADVYAKSFLA